MERAAKVIVGATVTAAALGAYGLWSAASAHTPVVYPTCGGVQVDATEYEPGSMVAVTINDVTKTSFGTELHRFFAADPRVEMRWRVVIDNRGDGPGDYDLDASGVEKACLASVDLTPISSTTTSTPTAAVVLNSPSVARAAEPVAAAPKFTG